MSRRESRGKKRRQGENGRQREWWREGGRNRERERVTLLQSADIFTNMSDEGGSNTGGCAGEEERQRGRGGMFERWRGMGDEEGGGWGAQRSRGGDPLKGKAEGQRKGK